MNSADGGTFQACPGLCVCLRVNGREATLQCVMNFDCDDSRLGYVAAGGKGRDVGEG